MRYIRPAYRTAPVLKDLKAMNLLNFYIPEWFFVALNLLILIVVLRKILWKRINRILDERSEKAAKTAQDSEDAATLKAEMEQLRLMFDAEMKSRTVELMKDARASAGQEYERIIADAEKKSEQILSAAKTKADHEYDVMIEDVKKQAVSIAIDMTGLLLSSDMNNDHNTALLNQFLADKDAV